MELPADVSIEELKSITPEDATTRYCRKCARFLTLDHFKSGEGRFICYKHIKEAVLVSMYGTDQKRGYTPSGTKSGWMHPILVSRGPKSPRRR
jgi:hypothetical protein